MGSYRQQPETKFQKWLVNEGFNIEDVADLTGLSSSYLSMIASGRREIGPALKKKIASRLRCRIRDLWEPPPAPREEEDSE